MEQRDEAQAEAISLEADLEKLRGRFTQLENECAAARLDREEALSGAKDAADSRSAELERLKSSEKSALAMRDALHEELVRVRQERDSAVQTGVGGDGEMARLQAELRRVQGAIAGATQLGAQRGCAALIVDAVRSAHGLVDNAERAADHAMTQAEQQSAALHDAWVNRSAAAPSE